MREVFASLSARARDDGQRIAVSDDRGAVDFHALAVRVAELASALPESADTIAIAGRAGVSWIVADLAATLAGRRVVPVPSFFSKEQVRHVLADSHVQRVLCCDMLGGAAGTSAWSELDLPTQVVDGHAPLSGAHQELHAYAGGAERVIYTSGTTGTPKGVVHGDRQMDHAIRAISTAVAASAGDLHLASLPASLLLEQIAGVFIPLAVGGRAHVSAAATEAAMGGNLQALLTLFTRLAPTTTVLVPQLLAAMTAAASAGAWTPPGSLRFAAVGGAPIPLALLRAARAVGIPVIRGYGLSECASVVAVERPGALVDETEGACGTALDGVHLEVLDGEVVVSGPTVMDGYLNAASLSSAANGGVGSGVWHTGDRGRLASDGTVVILGRCDRVLVLPNGRNVASDWVEAVVLTDVRYHSARVMLADDGVLMLEAVLRDAGAGCLSTVDDLALHEHLYELFTQLPLYARPSRVRLALTNKPGEIARVTELTHCERRHDAA